MNIPQIKFVFDRKNRATDTRKGTIDMRITYNRKQKFIATGVRCYPGQWSDKDESLIKGKAMDADEANAILIKLRKRILSIIGSMIDRDSIDINAIPMLIRQDSVDISFIHYQKEDMSKGTSSFLVSRCQVCKAETTTNNKE